MKGGKNAFYLRISALDINPLTEQNNIQEESRQGLLSALFLNNGCGLMGTKYQWNCHQVQWYWYKLGAQFQQADLGLFCANLYFIMIEGQLSTLKAGSQPAPLQVFGE